MQGGAVEVPAHEVAEPVDVQRDIVVAVGRRLVVRIKKDVDPHGGESWQTAFCVGPGELRNSDGGAARSDLPPGRLAVRTTRKAHTDRTGGLEAAPWEDLVPKPERRPGLSRELSMFHEFVRATNQIELLVLDATIYPYELVSRDEPDGGSERIVVAERPRPRRVLPFFELDTGLNEFLQRELDQAGKRDGASVILSGPQGFC